MLIGCDQPEEAGDPEAPPPTPPRATTAPPPPEPPPAPPKADPTEQQRELFDDAIAINQKLADCLSRVTDTASVVAATQEIAELAAGLESVAGQLAASEAPAPPLLEEFRRRADESDRQMLATAERTLPQIEASPEAVRALNRALESLANIRRHPAFIEFGIGKEQ